MLKNTLINRIATKKIAIALGELNNQVVYVGGAVVSLYIDDPSVHNGAGWCYMVHIGATF
tara:strand:- start:61 stop:240 length:180 start_codon:yes stop_codon:yes gene_type:complete